MIHDVFYVLLYPKHSGYVGVDEKSGGYPYRATEPGFIKYWRKKADALEYKEKFPKHEFELGELSFTVTRIKENTLEEQKEFYLKVMGPCDFRGTKYAVRLWDGMDGCWCDVGTNLDLEVALKMWLIRTKQGTKNIRFDEIDYYRIFPADTSMMYSGENTMRGEE